MIEITENGIFYQELFNNMQSKFETLSVKRFLASVPLVDGLALEHEYNMETYYDRDELPDGNSEYNFFLEREVYRRRIPVSFLDNNEDLEHRMLYGHIEKDWYKQQSWFEEMPIGFDGLLAISRHFNPDKFHDASTERKFIRPQQIPVYGEYTYPKGFESSYGKLELDQRTPHVLLMLNPHAFRLVRWSKEKALPYSAKMRGYEKVDGIIKLYCISPDSNDVWYNFSEAPTKERWV